MSEERAPYNGETPEDNQYQIRDEASPRDYYSQIPNLVDIMELSPHAYRLYGHLRRVAGDDGKCCQSTKTLAAACDMSLGKVSECKQELENVYPPLIRVESKRFDRGAYHEIAITDIWELNHTFFTGGEITVKTAKGKAFHNMNGWRSQCETLRSAGETKNNPVKNNPEPGVIQEIEKQANKKMDVHLDLLRQSVGKTSYPKRESLPEPIRELIDAFVEATGIKPLGKEAMSWLVVGQDWLSLGATPDDVKGALEYAKGKFAVMTPHSLTNTLRMYKAGGMKPQSNQEINYL